MTKTTPKQTPIDIVVKYAPQFLLVILIVAVLVLEPSVLTGEGIKDVLVSAVPIGILAIGAMWVLIGGGLDLSAGYGAGMCAIVCARELQAGRHPALAIAIAICAGLLIGLTNGLLVAALGMPPFIATLATMVAIQGINLMLGQVGTMMIGSEVMNFIGLEEIAGIPVMVLLLAAVVLVAYSLLRFSRFGLHTYAIGSDEEATRARGINVFSTQVRIYLMGGLMTALAGIVLAAHVQVVDPSIADTNLLLDAFAATILGGTSLFGGRGTALGTLTGVLFISLMTTLLVSMGVGPQQTQLVKGLMIVLAVVVDAAVRGIQIRTLARAERV